MSEKYNEDCRKRNIGTIELVSTYIVNTLYFVTNFSQYNIILQKVPTYTL